MKYFLFLFLGFIFFLKGVFFLDPDFGFHLRMGQVILQQGLPETDVFSYTMPSYPDLGEVWLLDVSIALLYPRIGMSSLAIIFSVLTVSTLWIMQGIEGTHQVRNGIRLFSLMICSAVLLAFTGVRPQVVSWFFLAIVLRIFLDSRWKRRGWFLLPVVFIFWSNIHGGFIAGLATMGITIASSWLFRVSALPKSSVTWGALRASMTGGLGDIGVFLLCILATSINPYGWQIYDDIVVVITSNAARWTIAEWYPTLLSLDMATGMVLSFSLFFTYRYRRTIEHRLLIVYCFYLLAALSSLRHVPLWLMIGYPTTGIGLQRMWENIRGNAWGRPRFLQVERLMVMVGVLFLTAQGIWAMTPASNRSAWEAYPVEAISYLRQFPSSGRLFSDYGWGGYLLWQLPEKKTFVDGRMALWINRHPPARESKNAFAEYLAIISQKRPVEQAIVAYDIDTVLLPVEKKTELTVIRTVLLALQQRLVKDTPVMGSLPSLAHQLERLGWRVVYQDQTARIWRRI